MNQPVPWRRPLERWRSAWPGEISDPFGEFTQLWNRIGHPVASLGEAGPGGWIPAVETEETSDGYVVRAELPGMKRADVDVELRGNELRIRRDVRGGHAHKIPRHRHGKSAKRSSLADDGD